MNVLGLNPEPLKQRSAVDIAESEAFKRSE